MGNEIIDNTEQRVPSGAVGGGRYAGRGGAWFECDKWWCDVLGHEAARRPSPTAAWTGFVSETDTVFKAARRQQPVTPVRAAVLHSPFSSLQQASSISSITLMTHSKSCVSPAV